MTANLAGPKGYGFPKRQHVAHRVFTDCLVDIAGLQECTPASWEALERASLELIETPTLVQDFAGLEEETYFNPIAFNHERFSRLDHGTRWLSADGTPKPDWCASTIRGVTFALLEEHETNNTLLVLNTQLDNKSVCARRRSVEEVILPLIEERVRMHGRDLPVLLLGDANVSIHSPEPRWGEPEMKCPYELVEDQGFADAWLETPQKRKRRPRMFHHYMGRTCADDEWGTYDPDWMFVRNLKIENCTPVEDNYGGVWPSDHYWGLAFLQWR
jgi:endonuclease/exonuclease/phosphatase family metal-dependent hydrolase